MTLNKIVNTIRQSKKNTYRCAKICIGIRMDLGIKMDSAGFIFIFVSD